MKFAVGTLLTSIGVFWGAEGAGAQWPGSDAALLVIIPLTALLAIELVAALRLERRRSHTPAAVSSVERTEALR